MLNRDGIRKITLTAPRQILANVDLQASVGCVVFEGVASEPDANGRKIAKAGTPISVNFANLQMPAEPAVSDVYEFESYDDDQGTTKFSEGTVAILGVDRDRGVTTACVKTNDVPGWVGKIFAIYVTPETLDSDAYYQLYEVDGTAVNVFIKIGNHTTVGNTGNAVLLHDVDVTNGPANGTALYFGVVNVNRLDPEIQGKVACGINVVGGVSFIRA